MKKYLYFTKFTPGYTSVIDTYPEHMSEEEILEELYNMYGKDNIESGYFL